MSDSTTDETREKVLVVYDFQTSEHPFKLALEQHLDVDVVEVSAPFPTRRTTFVRYVLQPALTVLFAIRVSRMACDYDAVIIWQQNIAIVVGAFCRLLRIRKKANVHVLTFIAPPARQRAPLRGIVNFALGWQGIKSIVCHSDTELAVYRRTFAALAGKLRFVRLATEEIPAGKFVVENGGYFVSAGRSNRDHRFLIEYFRDRSAFRLVVIDNELHVSDLPANVTIARNTFGDNYLAIVARCTATLICVNDPIISAGQLVFIHSAQLGKPVIVLGSESFDNYVTDGLNGFLIAKHDEALSQVLETIADPTAYDRLSAAQSALFRQVFSYEAFSEKLARLIRPSLQSYVDAA